MLYLVELWRLGLFFSSYLFWWEGGILRRLLRSSPNLYWSIPSSYHNRSTPCYFDSVEFRQTWFCTLEKSNILCPIAYCLPIYWISPIFLFFWTLPLLVLWNIMLWFMKDTPWMNQIAPKQDTIVIWIFRYREIEHKSVSQMKTNRNQNVVQSLLTTVA